MKKNRALIMGMAAGYEVEKIRPFLRSIAEFSPDATLVLVVDRVRPSVKAFAQTLNFTTVFVPLGSMRRALWRLFGAKSRLVQAVSAALALLPEKSKIRFRLITYVLHPATARFILYRPWLERHASEYDTVFMVDTRDVLILGELSALKVDRLTLAEESLRIADEPWTQSWLYGVGYQAREVFSFRMDKVICSGAIAGPVGEVIDYLDRYWKETSRMIEGVGFRFLEQALVVWIAKMSEWKEKTQVLPFQNPVLMNLGTSTSTDAQCILAEDGSALPAVLHQYDRIPEVALWIRTRYPQLFQD